MNLDLLLLSRTVLHLLYNQKLCEFGWSHGGLWLCKESAASVTLVWLRYDLNSTSPQFSLNDVQRICQSTWQWIPSMLLSNWASCMWVQVTPVGLVWAGKERLVIPCPPPWLFPCPPISYASVDQTYTHRSMPLCVDSCNGQRHQKCHK